MAPPLHEADGYTAGCLRIAFKRVFCVGEQGASFVEQLLDSMQLVVDIRKASVARLVRQLMGPSALKRDMVVYLIDHLLELASVHSVCTHGSSFQYHVGLIAIIVLYDWNARYARESVTKLSRSNILSASTDDILALFADYLTGSQPCVVLALSAQPLEDAGRNAIERSLESFGYGPSACTYAALSPADPSAEGGDVSLDAQALFLLVESIDPVCFICADAESARVLGDAYRMAFDLDAPARVFGRPAVVFRSLSTLLSTDAGKQQAWRLLKSLPKRS